MWSSKAAAICGVGGQQLRGRGFEILVSAMLVLFEAGQIENEMQKWGFVLFEGYDAAEEGLIWAVSGVGLW